MNTGGLTRACDARLAGVLLTAVVLPAMGWSQPRVRESAATPRADAVSRPRNLVLVIADDHRHDFLGFHERAPAFLETPHLDRMAREGAYFANAFVYTSLCSPSRASILSGLVTHRHGVIDNQRPVPPGTRFFPERLQKLGYETAFIGKWHMGHDHDEPRPGFDHWVSFRGQGTYFDPTLNTNGSRVEVKGYTTDILASEAVDWLRRERAEPFCLVLSFKAVHFPFTPAPRHRGRYHGKPIAYPETMANTEENYATQPRWVRERRYGIHGIDHMETGAFDEDPVPDFDALYWSFAETVHGLDENLGRVLAELERSGRSRDTLVVYLGDNGFALGEHGFYDKRDAYEVSIRVPLLAWAPGWIRAGTRIEELVQNIDIAPSVLDALGASADGFPVDGRSFVPLLERRVLEDGSLEPVPWRDHILYAYYWEWNFPACPTVFAIRTERHKYFFAHGVWDRDGLYDLATDPWERHNLIDVPAFASLARELRERLFDGLERSGSSLDVPFRRPQGEPYHDRKLRR